MPEFNLPFFLLGCVGGLLPDILRIIRNRYKTKLPVYLKNPNFWISIVLLVGVGGLTAWILNSLSAKDALIYGYASPQVLSQLASSVRSERVERGVEETEGRPSNLLKYWAS